MEIRCDHCDTRIYDNDRVDYRHSRSRRDRCTVALPELIECDARSLNALALGAVSFPMQSLCRFE